MGKRGPQLKFTELFRFRAEPQLIGAIEAAASRSGEKSSAYVRRILKEAIAAPEQPEPIPEQPPQGEQPTPQSTESEQWDQKELDELVTWALAAYDREQSKVEQARKDGFIYTVNYYRSYDLVDVTGLAMAELYSRIGDMPPLKQVAAVNALMTEINHRKADMTPFGIADIKAESRYDSRKNLYPGVYSFEAVLISEQCGRPARYPMPIHFDANSKGRKMPDGTVQLRTVSYSRRLIDDLKSFSSYGAFESAGGIEALDRALIRAIDKWFKAHGL